MYPFVHNCIHHLIQGVSDRHPTLNILPHCLWNLRIVIQGVIQVEDNCPKVSISTKHSASATELHGCSSTQAGTQCWQSDFRDSPQYTWAAITCLMSVPSDKRALWGLTSGLPEACFASGQVGPFPLLENKVSEITIHCAPLGAAAQACHDLVGTKTLHPTNASLARCRLNLHPVPCCCVADDPWSHLLTGMGCRPTPRAVCWYVVPTMRVAVG